MSVAMTNPFPGMNPYLEADWTDVHPTLLTLARAQLQKQMPGGLVVRVEQDIRVDDEAESWRFKPDIAIWPENASEHPPRSVAASSAAVAEPVRLHWPRPVPRRLVIKDANGTLVTAIELLSPSNKVGYDAYKYADKRSKLIAAHVNLVEIDLVRKGGLSAPLFNQEAFAGEAGWSRPPPYGISVFDAEAEDDFAFYPIWLADRLPAFRIPLRPMDKPAVLDLQPLIDQCYVDGAYWHTDYSRDPDPPLRGEDATWLDALLKSKGLR